MKYLYVSLVLALSGVSMAASVDTNTILEESDIVQRMYGEHTYSAIEPLIEKFKAEVVENTNKWKSNDDKIADLQEKVAKVQFQLQEGMSQLNLAVIEELQSPNSNLHDKNISDKKTIDQLTNNSLSAESENYHLAALQTDTFIKKIGENSETICKLNSQIENLKKQIDSDARKLTEYQDQLQEQSKTIDEQKQRITKMEIEARNCTDGIEYCEVKPTGCSRTSGNENGVQLIKALYSFHVLCNSETAGPGWTVIQQRIKGGVDFYRDWATYREGFGSSDGDFFLGLEKIHILTSAERHELYIHMEDFDGSIRNARYDNFSISNEADKYKLISLGKLSGNQTDDLLRWHENQKFTTFDNDNDSWDEGNCAKYRHGGWWYNNCVRVYLNGKYYNSTVNDYDSIYWTFPTNLKTVKMLIRPVDDNN